MMDTSPLATRVLRGHARFAYVSVASPMRVSTVQRCCLASVCHATVYSCCTVHICVMNASSGVLLDLLMMRKKQIFVGNTHSLFVRFFFCWAGKSVPWTSCFAVDLMGYLFDR